eukprot:7386380-Prymnesium_polylepis.2
MVALRWLQSREVSEIGFGPRCQLDHLPASEEAHSTRQHLLAHAEHETDDFKYELDEYDGETKEKKKEKDPCGAH